MSKTLNIENLGTEAVVRTQEECSPVSADPAATPLTATQIVQARLDRVIAFQRFLARASALLASSLDYETTLRDVARLAVPELADWCAVNVIDEDSQVRRIVVAHKSPEKLAWAEALATRFPYNPDAPRGLSYVLRTGKSEFYPEITDEMLVGSAVDDEHLAIMRDLGLTAVMIVPMTARGRTLGAITFVAAESGHSYTADDLAAAEDLALGAAMAVDNARLYSAAQQEIKVRGQVETELQVLNHRLQEAIREANHRVLNNLQIVAALIDMQLMDRREMISAKELVRLAAQIDTLAAVHIELTGSLKEAVPERQEIISARSVLNMLLPKLQPNNARGHIEYHLDEVLLSSRRATSLGLVALELCSNVFRHGGGEGNLTLTLQGERVLFEVCDFGSGFPPDFDPASQPTTGMELILSLTRRDLCGEARFVNRLEGGAQVTITFPKKI